MGLPTMLWLTLLCHSDFFSICDQAALSAFFSICVPFVWICVGNLNTCHSERLALSCCAYNYVMPSVQLCHVKRPALSCRAKSRHLLFLNNSGMEKSVACRPLDCARGDKNAYDFFRIRVGKLISVGKINGYSMRASCVRNGKFRFFLSEVWKVQ